MKNLLFSVLLAAACGDHFSSVFAAAPDHAATNTVSTQPHLVRLEVVASDRDLVRAELARKITPLICSNAFEQLDQLAAELRKSKKETASGTWHLNIFYDCTTLDRKETKEDLWQKRIQFFKQWAQARPSSITPAVALANLYIDYAWAARGGGYADTVTQEGWNLFNARLLKAHATLSAAAKLNEKCPVWWEDMLTVALGLSFSPTEYNRIFNEAVRFEPRYTPFYFRKSIYLQPRWSGTEGDWQKFASQSADQLGGEEGDILYARIGWRIHTARFYGSFIKDANYSWPRMARGLSLLCNRYSESLSAPSELAYLSFQYHDLDRARPLFERIGDRVESDVWNMDTAKFIRARNWALGSSGGVIPGVVMQSYAPPTPPATQGVSPNALPGHLLTPGVPMSYGGNILLKGISGSPPHRLALINDQTLAQGETANVKVEGKRVPVKCLQIKERSAIVVIAEASQPTELILP